MPKRAHSYAPNRQGFRTMIKRPRKRMYGKVQRPIARRSYHTRHAQDREIVALHDLHTYEIASTTDTFDCLDLAKVLNAPGLSRYTSRYDRVRFLKIKVQFYPTEDTVVALSTTSQSEKVVLTDKQVILRQKNCRFHQLKRSDGLSCGRTFDISKIAVLGDHVNCDTLSTTLSATNATTMDCGIHYAFLHSDWNYKDTAVGAPAAVPQKVHCKFTWVCEFYGLQQVMAELD